MQWLSCFDNVKCNISDIAIIIIKNVDYRCIIHNIRKFKAINLLESSALETGGYI